MITVQILTKNNSKTILTCLESLKEIDCEILVGDLGSNDDTISIASNFAKVINLKFKNDYAEAKNELTSFSNTDWMFWLDPWESVNLGHDSIVAGASGKVYMQIGNVLFKETRLWNRSKVKFINPVYERLDSSDEQLLDDIFLLGGQGNRQVDEILKAWRAMSPTSLEVDYYEACDHLANNRYIDFIRIADRYLFRETRPVLSSILCRYYHAIIELHVNKEPGRAIQTILPALAHKPLMAEFWCLLGDCFCKLKQNFRAIQFYENAIILGSRRTADDYPIEIAKYREYPELILSQLRRRPS